MGKDRAIYKVVRVLSSGKRMSMAVKSRTKYCVEYKEGMAATPKIGKLFAYRRKFDAICFAKMMKWRNQSVEVWTAAGTNATSLAFRSWDTDSPSIGRFWQLFDEGSNLGLYKYSNDITMTVGVVGCDSITLKKRVAVF